LYQNYCTLIVPELLHANSAWFINFLYAAMALSDKKRRMYKKKRRVHKEEESVQKEEKGVQRREGCAKKRRVYKKKRRVYKNWIVASRNSRYLEFFQ
jgi:hypothetical protein